jgi:hypothetical protein
MIRSIGQEAAARAAWSEKRWDGVESLDDEDDDADDVQMKQMTPSGKNTISG